MPRKFLQVVAQHPGAVLECRLDAQGCLESVVWALPEHIEAMQLHGDVWIQDNTCKTLVANRPMFAVVRVDGNSRYDQAEPTQTPTSLIPAVAELLCCLSHLATWQLRGHSVDPVLLTPNLSCKNHLTAASISLDAVPSCICCLDSSAEESSDLTR